MAIFKIFPESDTFIYSEYPTGNAGKDEVIEIAGYKDISGVGRTSRAIVKFSTTEIQSTLNNTVGANAWVSNLDLYLASANELPISHSIYAYPVAESWDNGVGKFG